MDAITAYLAEEYFTLKQLSAESNTTTDQIIELIQRQCIPPHTYELTPALNLRSEFDGTHILSSPTIHYYHPSLVNWISRANNLLKILTLNQVMNKVRDDFFKEHVARFNHQATPGCQDVSMAWHFLMNGTWGICLRELSVECMATKELARLKISRLVNHSDSTHELTEREKNELRVAIKEYYSAAKRFSPHVIATSSLMREVEPAREKYFKDEQLLV